MLVILDDLLQQVDADIAGGGIDEGVRVRLRAVVAAHGGEHAGLDQLDDLALVDRLFTGELPEGVQALHRHIRRDSCLSFLPSDVKPGARALVVGECPALLLVPDDDPEPPLCALHPLQRSHELLAAVALGIEAHVYLVAHEPFEVLPPCERPVDPGARYFEDVPLRHHARALELRLHEPREPGALVEGDPPKRVHVGTHDRTAVRSGDLQVDQLGTRLLDDRLDDGDQAAGVRHGSRRPRKKKSGDCAPLRIEYTPIPWRGKPVSDPLSGGPRGPASSRRRRSRADTSGAGDRKECRGTTRRWHRAAHPPPLPGGSTRRAGRRAAWRRPPRARPRCARPPSWLPAPRRPRGPPDSSRGRWPDPTRPRSRAGARRTRVRAPRSHVGRSPRPRPASRRAAAPPRNGPERPGRRARSPRS